MPTRAKPVAYLYLNDSGIESLYSQTVERLQVEFSTTVEKALSGRVGAAARLKNLFSKFLGGPELEISGDINGSRKKIEQSTQRQSTEPRLASLIAALNISGEPTIFSELGRAARHADSMGATVFICTEDKFNAPQFYSADGASLVNRDGYLLLEKGGIDDYESEDHYYKMDSLNRLARLSASILKMPDCSKGMGLTGHEAVFLRGFGGRRVPLGVFAHLTATPAYFALKPYAIWRR